MTLSSGVDQADFSRMTDPFRGELLAHCYRLLGSPTDAEDLVQETYLRAWRSFDTFEGRSSVRTWLYQIATNACLTERARAKGRPLPAGLAGPSEEFALEPDRVDVEWLQPFPGAQRASDPADVAVSRASLRLAFIAALQHLPAKQRAALVLRDVLKWPGAEVAQVLGVSVPAANSLLQRARQRLGDLAMVEEDVLEPHDPGARRIVSRYMDAFHSRDLAGLVSLLNEDVTLQMPPIPTWFSGRDAVAHFLGVRVLSAVNAWRMFALTANAQPAIAGYLRDGELFRPDGIHVLTITPGGISGIVAFRDPSLLGAFGLPATLEP